MPTNDAMSTDIKPTNETQPAGKPGGTAVPPGGAEAGKKEARLKEEVKKAPPPEGVEARLPNQLPVVEPPTTRIPNLREVFAGLKQDNVLARMPHFMQRDARNILGEVMNAIVAEVEQVERAAQRSPEATSYKTVDHRNNLREVTPGREPRAVERAALLPLPTTADLTPAAPPAGAAPPVPDAPRERDRGPANPRGPR